MSDFSELVENLRKMQEREEIEGLPDSVLELTGQAKEKLDALVSAYMNDEDVENGQTS
jgi:hypothetical protein